MAKIQRSKTRIYLDADNVIRIELASYGSLEDAKNLVRDSEKIVHNIQGWDGLAMIDMRGVSLPSILPFRKFYQESAKIGSPRKAAILGDSRLIWVLATFVYSASGMMNTEQKVKYFTSEKEAVDWLKKSWR